MNARALWETIEASGGRLEVKDGRLRLAGRLPPELAATALRHKDAVRTAYYRRGRAPEGNDAVVPLAHVPAVALGIGMEEGARFAEWMVSELRGPEAFRWLLARMEIYQGNGRAWGSRVCELQAALDLLTWWCGGTNERDEAEAWQWWRDKAEMGK